MSATSTPLPLIGVTRADEPALMTMDEHHAEFVAAHVQVEPEPLPEGAAHQVEEVVDHLHTVVEGASDEPRD